MLPSLQENTGWISSVQIATETRHGTTGLAGGLGKRGALQGLGSHSILILLHMQRNSLSMPVRVNRRCLTPCQTVYRRRPMEAPY
jgi:hypothetical protein